MTYLVVLYVLVGLLVAETVRRDQRVTLQRFWRGHVISNLIMVWIWPAPVFTAFAAFVVDWVDRK